MQLSLEGIDAGRRPREAAERPGLMRRGMVEGGEDGEVSFGGSGRCWSRGVAADHGAISFSKEGALAGFDNSLTILMI